MKVIEFLGNVFESIALDIINTRLVRATIKTFLVIYISALIWCSPIFIIELIAKAIS